MVRLVVWGSDAATEVSTQLQTPGDDGAARRGLEGHTQLAIWSRAALSSSMILSTSSTAAESLGSFSARDTSARTASNFCFVLSMATAGAAGRLSVCLSVCLGSFGRGCNCRLLTIEHETAAWSGSGGHFRSFDGHDTGRFGACNWAERKCAFSFSLLRAVRGGGAAPKRPTSPARVMCPHCKCFLVSMVIWNGR